MPQRSTNSRDAHPGDVLLVNHDFDARGADELTLRRGDKVELLELDEGFGDGWYLGRHVSENRTGLFPGVYTVIAPKIGIKKTKDASPSTEPLWDSSTPELDSPSLGSSRDPVSPVSNDETTPQPSRHVSAIDMKPLSGVDAESGDGTTAGHTTQRPASAGSTQASPTIRRTISETLGNMSMNGEDSPVLNETLSVIDEHITNFSTPRHSIATQENHSVHDSSSEYSSYPDHRLSYIRGEETDEEEERMPSEAEVRKWDHQQMARHLRDIGVDPKHCDIFESQEISGDVLLDMDQEFIYMREFDFGVMGRRLKTWHKIRAFQEEIQGPRHLRKASSHTAEDYDRSQTKSVMSGSYLPRIPTLGEKHRHSPHSSRTRTTVKYRDTSYGSQASAPPLTQPHDNDATTKPSADSIRRSNHHRYSSIENTSVFPLADSSAFSASRKAPAPPHEKKPSFDRNWMMNPSPTTNSNTNNTSNSPRPSSSLAATKQFYKTGSNRTDDSSTGFGDSVDFDRGYFSGGDVDGRKQRKVLRKRDSSKRSYSHSRHSSLAAPADDKKKRHSRFGSTGSMRDLASVKPLYPKRHSQDFTINSTLALLEDESHSPTVTNLEPTPESPTGFLSSIVGYGKTNNDGSGRSSPLPTTSSLRGITPKVRRTIGLRAISDAVTGIEKTRISSPVPSSGRDLPQSPTRTDSSTPSGTGTSRSLEIDSTESSRLEGLATMKNGNGTQRTKSKKDTSAYRRGLEKKTPKEQMQDADYYGWMKKKSSNLMTTWKPRLFILKGRRLSYYYSEDDTEERGLIDISSHRVFRADQDAITSLHATLTRAKALPATPSNNDTPAEQTDGEEKTGTSRRNSSAEPPFIFKLVPPKAGISRAVQFTKPAIHFFQVDNIQQGRLWMAAIMKATIERDLNLPVKTTNKQKTITLKQARLLAQTSPTPPLDSTSRPPKPEEDSSRNTSASNSATLATPVGETSADEFQKIGDIDTGSSSLFPDMNPVDHLQSAS
ncbi:conserved hypothetical protein [Microsporum canis CBS 113480]|uniref:Polarized growth protein Boi2 n=1 Tax=Arthroderma otae (strain ATCC MYA-4605 / CBS 113480) TaxID=554155 RepID=C5FSG9_ARTOC|nr:conserved hypothetical protein [Microsporum canis CBS 113480]EEQ32822.1 conserved hypothetical protein [Microsporum canis CBS 113480]